MIALDALLRYLRIVLGNGGLAEDDMWPLLAMMTVTGDSKECRYVGTACAAQNSTSTMSTQDAHSLSSFSSCEISDALIKLGVPHGGFIPDVYMLSPAPWAAPVKICAPAYTVKMVPASDKDAPKLSTHFVDTATPGSVIVIDAPSRSVCPYTSNSLIYSNIGNPTITTRN